VRQQQVRRRRTRGSEASTGVEEPPPARLSPAGATADRVLEAIDEVLASR
jgi:hypothetical protein